MLRRKDEPLGTLERLSSFFMVLVDHLTRKLPEEHFLLGSKLSTCLSRDSRFGVKNEVPNLTGTSLYT